MSTAPELVSTSSVHGRPPAPEPIRNGSVATAVRVDDDFGFGCARGSDENWNVVHDTSLPYCGSVGLGKPSERRAAGSWARDIEYTDRTGHSRARRVATRNADCFSVLAGGLATVVILNFNQAQGMCPAVENDPRWPAMLPLLAASLPRQLRCPSAPLYVTAIAMYSAAGICQLAREPKYWADCALLAALGSVVAGALCGVRSMLDALILGGFLSLVCCKGIAVWSTGRTD